jgi:non-lysosomal glucosylceramidase
VGEGCLADQLIGQYLADVCGLGPLVKAENFKTATASVYRYNYKRDLSEHANVQRTFALNDESALLVCDYKPGTRPTIPFPYYAELFTGIEYLAAAQMVYAGMNREGVEVTDSVRLRYDGERRNPWDEAECGHHYARAMAAWSGLLALSGWRYYAPEKRVEIRPRSRAQVFRCFWSAGTAWGTFEKTAAGTVIKVEQGELPVASVWMERQGRLVKAGPAKETVLKAGESLRV